MNSASGILTGQVARFAYRRHASSIKTRGDKMKTFVEKKIEMYRGMVLAGFGLGFALLLVALLQSSHPNVHIDRCPFDSTGKAIPDRSVDGVLSVAAGIYFVHRPGMDDSIVASCLGKGGCRGPANEMRQHLNEPVHVEYCGHTLIGVTASGIKVFEANPDTQVTIDAKARAEKRIGVFIGVTLVLFGVLCFLKLRLLRREAGYVTG